MKSKRNKTITASNEEIENFSFLSLPREIDSISALENRIFLTDSLKSIKLLPNNSIDLILTDPPYNNRKNFGDGTVNLSETEFEKWNDSWIKECFRILKPNGSIYVCIDWQNSGLIQDVLKKYFIIKNRVTWKREKGRGSKTNWKNNMEDIWFATKSNDYTFNVDQVKIKKEVIAPYTDSAGNPKDWIEEDGKKFRMTCPSNIWTDLTVPFWSMPENTEHPTQKPEKLIERIILASSSEEDLIFDPFLGSGTTCAVAKRLKRKYLGFEINKKYYILASKRLDK
ncbi:MAG TPA: DNA methyltransferase [Candidatus Bipolaricaulota bacterium]|nr:DNA methyltransferase [Candidatus Bipolaricaulota bacterium]